MPREFDGKTLPFKCPHCNKPLVNINNFGSINQSVDIRELYAKWPEKVRKSLRKICRSIIRTIPSENRQAARKFLIAIEGCKPEVVEWGLNQYHAAKHVNRGKGFPYLRAIIQNHDKNRESLKEMENKRLGGNTLRYKMEDISNEQSDTTTPTK
jgi:hypothetical protein|tara:strand:- start:628 stop:1089 length:462 start_codon:yes stop_codon:yes gene_type:complete